jgi:hypothetical protein
MRKILVPLFSLMMSFNAYGEWTLVAEGESDDNILTFYVDFDSIKIKGNVYYWELVDKLKPDQYGDLSLKSLFEVNCNAPRKRRVLSALYYTESMGRGSTSTNDNQTRPWTYSPPDSVGAATLNSACIHANQ